MTFTISTKGEIALEILQSESSIFVDYRVRFLLSSKLTKMRCQAERSRSPSQQEIPSPEASGSLRMTNSITSYQYICRGNLKGIKHHQVLNLKLRLKHFLLLLVLHGKRFLGLLSLALVNRLHRHQLQ